MTQSMTGFGAASGSAEGYVWRWEVRSVNARGLDIRLRLPDWIDGLETEARRVLTGAFGRGSLTAQLRIERDGDGQGDAQIAAALTRVAEVEAQASAAGVSLVPTSAADILAMRPPASDASERMEPLRAALLRSLEDAVAGLRDARVSEGTALAEIVGGHLAEIQDLTASARTAEKAARETRAEALREAMRRVLDTVPADEGRLEQELALVAVKADIAEEIDRLGAHVAAGHALLEAEEPAGRKLDFLTQELNREANTLCSKASSKELTEIGLALKAVIDRVREQVRNVE